MAMMNLWPGIFASELPMFSVRSAGSLKRRLAKVVFGAVLVTVSAPLSHADRFTMSATFSDGSVGTGSFMTDPTMCINFKCTEGSGLFNFSFSVLDATFNDADAAIGQFTFFSQLDKISSALMPDGPSGDHIQFTPTGTGTFSTLWIDGGVPKISNNGVVVPEPSSLILLLTALAVTAMWRVPAVKLNGPAGNGN
jgi:hypothetical protein